MKRILARLRHIPLAKTRAFWILTAVLLPTSLLLAQDLPDLMHIQPGRSRAVTSADPNPNSNADRIKYITPGETKVLADIKDRRSSGTSG